MKEHQSKISIAIKDILEEQYMYIVEYSRGPFDLFILHVHLREVVKTTILEQDPPNHKIDDGFCLHPPPPPPQPQKMVSLLY